VIARGHEAEQAALHYLQQQGLKLIAQNYRCRHGEIDLIMRDGEVVVFTEVRLRRSNAFGGGLASVDGHKQRRILAAARHYLGTLRETPLCRCDVVLLSNVNAGDFEWLKNAFSE
jgi:putative endonuclease